MWGKGENERMKEKKSCKSHILYFSLHSKPFQSYFFFFFFLFLSCWGSVAFRVFSTLHSHFFYFHFFHSVTTDTNSYTSSQLMYNPTSRTFYRCSACHPTFFVFYFLGLVIGLAAELATFRKDGFSTTRVRNDGITPIAANIWSGMAVYHSESSTVLALDV